MQVACSGCARPLTRRAGGISLFALGDEVIETWYLCPSCDQWTVDVWLDRFMGEGEARVRGPLPRAHGDERVARIRACPDPGNKWCECEVHGSW